ncbi:hypothetical protein ACA910_016782 [Epithemia clementina (nom. ined.)]
MNMKRTVPPAALIILQYLVPLYLLLQILSLARLKVLRIANKTPTRVGSDNYFPLITVPVAASVNPTTTLHVYKHKLSRKVFMLNTTDSFSVIAPYSSNNSHALRLERVSVQAGRHNCSWGINGGPFHKDGSTAGALIIDGKIIIDDFGGAAGFGVTGKPTVQWVLGSLTKERAYQLGVVHFVTGFDWLVYNGENVAAKQRFKPAIKRAPRTAVGVDKTGNLLIIVADGCERCLQKRGPTLDETADFLVEVGVAYAVNMDGGSSSTMTRQRRVINKPTCLDIDVISCSRPVASAICIRRATT